jgi:Cu/Ag efflux pump CusA
VPLAIATGAGAVSRRTIGTIVIGGMLAASCIAVCLIPVLFFVVEKFASRRRAEKPEAKADSPLGPAPSEGAV